MEGKGRKSTLSQQTRHARLKQRPRKRRLSPLFAIIAAMVVLGALVSAPWMIPVILIPKPQVAPRAPRPKEAPRVIKRVDPAAAKTAADRKALKEAIDRYDVAEVDRRKKLNGIRTPFVKARATANGALRKEAAQIARRMTTVSFTAELLKAKAHAQVPQRLGGDPLAADSVIAKTVGGRTVDLQKNYQSLVKSIVAQATGVNTRSAARASNEASAHQVKLGKHIIRNISRQMSPYAKSRAVAVLKRTVAKLPAAGLDGPLPAVELALFSATIADVYQQGAPARQAARLSVFNSVMAANNIELDDATKSAAEELGKYDRLQKRQNCADLWSAYQRTPIQQLKMAVTGRCRSKG